jgi:hypothetical protein
MIVEDSVNYPTVLGPRNIPFQKRWPESYPIGTIPSIIANGHDRQFLPQVAQRVRVTVASRPLLTRLRQGSLIQRQTLVGGTGTVNYTDKRIPYTMVGPRYWPNQPTGTIPSVMSILMGPSRQMHPQQYRFRPGPPYASNAESHMRAEMRGLCVLPME